MDEYLIDTNILFDMMHPAIQHHQQIWENRRMRKAVLHLPVIALGEADLGICLSEVDQSAARRDIATFLTDNGIMIQQITRHTACVYGDVKARLVRRYCPEKKANRVKWPERWTDPATGAELGVDECDLWIAAQAIERNLVLVTADKMARLTDVISELRIENWRHPLNS